MAYNVKEQKDGKKEGSVRVNRKELIEAVKVAKKYVCKTIPLASGICIDPVNGRLWTTNLENVIDIPVDITNRQIGEGSFIIAPDLLCKALKTAKSNDVEIVMAEQNVTIDGISLPTMSMEDFPARYQDVGPMEQLTSLNAVQIKQLMSVPANKEDRMPYQRSVLFDGKNKSMVKTNGHALNCVEIETESNRLVMILDSMFHAFKGEEVLVNVNYPDKTGEKYVMLSGMETGITVVNRVPDGSYPDWKIIIDGCTNGYVPVTFHRDDMIEAAKQILQIAAKDCYATQFNINEKIKLTYSDPSLSAPVIRQVNINEHIDPERVMVLSAKLIVDMLNNLRGIIEMKISDGPYKPMLFNDYSGFTGVIMPMKM